MQQPMQYQPQYLAAPQHFPQLDAREQQLVTPTMSAGACVPVLRVFFMD